MSELNRIRLVYPYFNNPAMLKRQVENWSRISGQLKVATYITLVDDHSKGKCNPEPIMRECTAKCELLRFTEPGIWGMHEARNLGALGSKQHHEWLFMSDIDLILTPEVLYTLASMRLDPKSHYTFGRVMAPDMSPKHGHCNSYLLTLEAYRFINGYDVDFTGTFGGGYGGDGEFSRQLNGVTPRVHLEHIKLIGHEREAVSDANTTQWDRDEWKLKYRKVFDKKRATGDLRSINPIRRQWERVDLKEKLNG